jgi:hypothetical protein
MECAVYKHSNPKDQYLTKRIVDMVFINAKTIVDMFQIQDQVEAYRICEEQWLSVQRVPMEMISNACY